MLSVSRQNSGQPSNVRVISTTVSEGTLKKTRKDAGSNRGNYITLYFYQNAALTDSLTLAHPLYKSLEYPAGNNTFAVKDTVLSEAEFFVRFKVTAPGTEIKITETLQPSPPRQIAFIKL
ncbi:MAG: hypothetical protein EOP51_22790 [Sphingobacteriales bacterium]|nr:MAG: hypothetical protein EOP51_22790 [Sphingobacteriales bacterium]